MRAVKRSTARTVLVFMTDSTDHVTGKAGLTLTITASKAGAAFASISPTVTDRGSGWYALDLTTSHTDTLGDLGIHATATGADPTDMLLDVVAYDPADATALGISRLDAAVTTRAVAGDQMTLQDDAITDAKIAAGAITSSEAPALANLDAAVSTRLAAASYTAPDNAGIADAVAAAEAVDARLPSDPADESTIQAAIATRAAPGDAMALISDALTAAALAADAVTEIQAGLATAAALVTAQAGITDIKAKTDLLPADPASDTTVLTRMAAASYTSPDNAGIAAIKAKTDNLPTDPADESLLEAAIATRAAPGDAMTLTAAYDAAKTAAQAGDDMGITAGAIADILGVVIDGTETLLTTLRYLLAMAAGDSSGFPSDPKFKNPAGTKDRLVAELDSYGNRTMVSRDGT